MTREPRLLDRLRCRVVGHTVQPRPPLPLLALERALGERGTGARLRRLGLAPVRFASVPVDELLVQRPVLSEVVATRDAAPLAFLDAYFRGPDGTSDWRVVRSMHAALVRTVLDDPHADLRETDYWRWHVALREAGVNERPDEWIERKARALLGLAEEVRAGRYRYGGLRSYVWALERRLIATRYGYDDEGAGYEIYDGHHRAAVAAALGVAELPVLLLRDVGTATPFGVPLDEVTPAR